MPRRVDPRFTRNWDREAYSMGVLSKKGMETYLNELGQRVRVAVGSTQSGKIPLSYDYVILADNPISTENLYVEDLMKLTDSPMES